MQIIQTNAGLFSTVLGDLEPSPDSASLNTRGTFFQHQGQEVFAGRDSRGFPHLLVPVDSGAISVDSYQPSTGLKVVISYFNISGVEKQYVDIACLRADADDIFGAICNDYCQKISENVANTDLLTTFDSTIEKWREILKAIVEKEPTENEITGLIGELLVLESAIQKFGPSAIDFWFGQDKTRHDFEFPNVTVEVKTSKSTASKKIRVHGLSQFQVTPGQQIKLVLFQAERSPQGESVAGIISRVMSLGISPEKIQEKVLRFGETLVTSAPKWAKEYKLSIVASSIYAIGDQFPTLSKDQLTREQATRLSSFEYDLNLNGLPCAQQSGLALTAIAGTLF